MPNPCAAGKTKILAVQNGDADQPDDDTGDAARMQFFVAGSGHHQHGEHRRGRVQDRGQPAGDIGLSGDDQRERQDVVENRDGEERLPA